MSTFIEGLREECGYDPEKDGSIDDLIAYKDALEDTLGMAEEQLQKELTAANLYYRENGREGQWLDGDGAWKDWESEAEERETQAKIDTLKMALAILHGNLREVAA